MQFTHRFEVDQDPARVAAFHTSPDSMAAITPPPIVTRMHRAPDRLHEGAEMDFTLWLGPLPLRWSARIEDVGPERFTDVQQRGPFDSWVHRHAFEPLGDGRTAVVDRIEARLRRHPVWGAIGVAMWLGLPLLFRYRAWRTRRLLESGRTTVAVS